MRILRHRKILVIAIALLWPLFHVAQPAHEYNRKYTKEHPLIYSDSWDLAPYVFLNERGEPDGYNVDIVKLLLNELRIPYVIKLKPTLESQEEFNDNNSDLLIGNDSIFPQKFSSKNIIVQFNYSLIHPKSMQMDNPTLEKLRGQQFYVRRGSRYYQHIKNAGLENNTVLINDMTDALKKISTEQEGLVISNTLSAKWILDKYQMVNLESTNIDLPQVAYTILSDDSLLITRLDSVYAILSANGRLHPLQAKWFFPEKYEDSWQLPTWMWYLLLAAFIVAMLLIYYNYSYRTRERLANIKNQQYVERLALTLQVSNVRLWTYEVEKNMFTWYDNRAMPKLRLTPEEAASRCHHNLFGKILEKLEEIKNGHINEATIEIREKDELNPQDPTNHDFSINISVLRRNNDKPSVIMGVKSDITEQRSKERYSKAMLARYQAIFTTSMVDMIYYDQNGYIANMNERAQQTFKKALEIIINERKSLKEFINYNNFDFEHFNYYYATEFLNKDGRLFNLKTDKLSDAMLYELQLIAMRDKEGNTIGYYGTGQDVSEIAASYHKVIDGIKKLKNANESIASYVNNIDYAMKMGGIRIVYYSPDTHSLTIYYGQSGNDRRQLTQTRCLNFVDEQDKRPVTRLFANMDNRTDKALEISLKTVLHNNMRHPIFLLFQFVPNYDEEGKLQEYFGVCRDVSDIKHSELLLEAETARAQEVESLKNAFLRNMSYEIRTPLNTIMGFAELLEQEHSKEEEALFIKEMKKNSGHLLHLINDILFLSRLDAHMIEIKPQPTDFAATFESHCNRGWDPYRTEEVQYVTQNLFEHLIVNIDNTNVGHIIEQVTANAAQNTTSGSVIARYDYVVDKIIITVDDTGCGMSEKMLKNIFKRFSKEHTDTTGLGMPVCQELVNLMNGKIEYKSQVGKGTTVWITIPCNVINIERNKV